jgi:hypothetical protein
VVIALFLFALSALVQTPETAAGAALPMELAVESVPNAIDVPLGQLRAQLGELPAIRRFSRLTGTYGDKRHAQLVEEPNLAKGFAHIESTLTRLDRMA